MEVRSADLDDVVKYVALGRAAEAWLREQARVAFGLLVCEPQLTGYYGRLGCAEFAGRLLVTQRGVPAEFL